MSEAGMVDAQMGTARILKPMLNFEALFQGQQAVLAPNNPSIPIPFFEWENRQPPNPRDPLAGKEGFDPNLLRFLDVPHSATLKVWIPQILWIIDGTITLSTYRYMPVWRNTSLGVYSARANTGQLPGQYHLPEESPGAPDSLAPPGKQKRFVLPAATNSIIYNLPEPLDPFAAANVHVRRQYFVIRGGEAPAPPLIGPGVFGVYQQGILDPALVTPVLAAVALFEEITLEVQGDGLLFVCDREGPTPPAFPTWDFTASGADVGFSQLYGTGALDVPHPAFPELGIYVWTGTTP